MPPSMRGVEDQARLRASSLTYCRGLLGIVELPFNEADAEVVHGRGAQGIPHRDSGADPHLPRGGAKHGVKFQSP